MHECPAFRASLGQAIYEREYTKTILNTVIDPMVVLGKGLQVQTPIGFLRLFGPRASNAGRFL